MRQCFTREQKKAIAEQISLGLDRAFPGKGGQQKLAAMVGVTPAAITHWKKGHKSPSLHHLVLLSGIFDIRIHVLCGFKGDRLIESDNPIFRCIINLSIVDEILEEKEGKMSPTMKTILDAIDAHFDLLKKSNDHTI